MHGVISLPSRITKPDTAPLTSTLDDHNAVGTYFHDLGLLDDAKLGISFLVRSRVGTGATHQQPFNSDETLLHTRSRPVPQRFKGAQTGLHERSEKRDKSQTMTQPCKSVKLEHHTPQGGGQDGIANERQGRTSLGQEMKHDSSLLQER